MSYKFWSVNDNGDRTLKAELSDAGTWITEDAGITDMLAKYKSQEFAEATKKDSLDYKDPVSLAVLPIIFNGHRFYCEKVAAVNKQVKTGKLVSNPTTTEEHVPYTGSKWEWEDGDLTFYDVDGKPLEVKGKDGGQKKTGSAKVTVRTKRN